MVEQFYIIFLDNSISRIYKSIDAVKEGFPGVEVFTTEAEFLAYLELHQPHVIMLNLDLTPRDAIALLNDLRTHPSAINSFIIIYSAKEDDFIQELAFESGADGFINFHEKPTILKLFLRNLMRRKILPQKRKKQMVIDDERYLVLDHGIPVQLPKKEFLLFSFLYTNPEKFYSKKEIAMEVWKDELVAKKRIIEVHIYRIRQFLGRRIIVSKKGEGYRINKKLIS